MIGTTLAHYEILDLLGRGGMGEVYRARDSKLDREVALKLLPTSFAEDPERLARFRREAKLLASLNHTNIAGIHGLEQAQGKTFLAMELAEGEDLSVRLRRGAIPMDESLDIARQIAEGLEEAHEKGIVHRDLKPGNVKLAPDGRVKILDFGLARAYAGDTAQEDDPANSPTITAAMTHAGTILGTAAYMSPEQAKGKTVDRRADLWSFGVILWEMLTGRQLFEGETISDTLAAVLRAEPEWDALPEDTPPAVRRLLERCLERDPRKRLRDIGEARVRLERWRDDPSTMMVGDPSQILLPDDSVRRRGWIPWAVAIVALAAAAIGWMPRGTKGTDRAPAMELEIQLERQDALQVDTATNVFLSPTGDEIAYLAAGQIYLRRLDQRQTRPLAGTEGAQIACYSPDGQWIAFTAEGMLKRVSVTGGSPVDICEAVDSRGIAWVDESTLVFSPTFSSGLSVVSLSDGIVRPLTTLDVEKAERSHRWPSPMPDGRSVIFLCQYFGRDYDEGDLQVVDLETGERKTVYRGGASPRYLPSGHLLFARERTVFAIAMDPVTHEARGLATPVIDNVWTSIGDQEACDGSAQFDVAPNGLLVYRTATAEDRRMQLAWYDLGTGALEPFGSIATQTSPVLSPDRRKLAVMRGEDASTEIYVIDLETGVENRLTFEDGGDLLGCWSPDGKHLYYSRSTGDGGYVVYRKPSDGSGVEEELTREQVTVLADDVSPDGRWLLLTVWGGGDMWDLRLLDLEEPGSPAAMLVDGVDMQYGGDFSPDGRWFVYHQARGGEWQLYVRRFPDTGARWQILQSDTQLQETSWSDDQQWLHTRDGRGFLSIPLQFEGEGLRAAPARTGLSDGFLRSNNWATSATLPDASRAVILVPQRTLEERGSRSMSAVVLQTGWLEELRRRVPVGR